MDPSLLLVLCAVASAITTALVYLFKQVVLEHERAHAIMLRDMYRDDLHEQARRFAQFLRDVSPEPAPHQPESRKRTVGTRLSANERGTGPGHSATDKTWDAP